MKVWMGRGVIGHFKQWLQVFFIFYPVFKQNVKNLEEVPYDVLEVLDIIVGTIDVVEPRNLDQPSVVVTVHVVADRPGN